MNKHMNELVILVLAAVIISSSAFKLIGNKHHHAEKKSKSDTQSGAVGSEIYFENVVPDDVTIANLYETVELHCKAGGSPNPTIHWLYNGSRIYQGDKERLIDEEASYENTERNSKIMMQKTTSTKSKLVLKCVTPEIMGLYTCVAETPTERIVTSTQLVITNQISETSVDKQCQPGAVQNEGVAPVIYMWTNNRVETSGADVQLFCRATGNPRPHIVWTNSNTEEIIQSDETKGYLVLPSGDLLIKEVSWPEHFGTFNCLARNDYGEDEVGAFFYPVAPS